MTDEELKEAAYRLCKIQGLNPEEHIQEKSDSELDSLVTTARWMTLVPKIKEHWQINEALLTGKLV